MDDRRYFFLQEELNRELGKKDSFEDTLHRFRDWIVDVRRKLELQWDGLRA